MINFILLVILPMLFAGAIIAIFMYCSHYLLDYTREFLSQTFSSPEQKDPNAPQQ